MHFIGHCHTCTEFLAFKLMTDRRRTLPDAREVDLVEAGLLIESIDFAEALDKIRSDLSDNIGAPKV